MIALALLACGKSDHWTLEHLPPKKLKVEDMLALQGGDLLIGGRARRNVEVFRRDPRGAYQSVWKEDRATALYDLYQEPEGAVWLLSREIRDRGDGTVLYRSTDEAETWEEVFWFACWIDHIVKAADGALWVRGDDELYRSTDQGRTFASVEVPWTELAWGEGLMVEGDTILVNGETALHRTTDGTSWTTTPTDVHLQWFDEHYLAGRRNKGPVFARRGEPFKPVFDGLGEVLMAASNGDEIWMLARWDSGRLSSGGLVMHSRDGGASWVKESHVGTSSKNAGHIEADGTVYTDTIYHPGSIWIREP